MQAELEAKSLLYAALKSPKLFSKCGRLVHLRVRRYKKTSRPMFQLQTLKCGKQIKTEGLYKDCFTSIWSKFFNLWRLHFNMSTLEIFELNKQIIIAKRLYMNDVFNIENSG
jgi:hypothetical protein